MNKKERIKKKINKYIDKFEIDSMVDLLILLKIQQDIEMKYLPELSGIAKEFDKDNKITHQINKGETTIEIGSLNSFVEALDVFNKIENEVKQKFQEYKDKSDKILKENKLNKKN